MTSKRRACEMCQKGIAYGVYADGVHWMVCLGCIAQFRTEGKRVLHHSSYQRTAALAR